MNVSDPVPNGQSRRMGRPKMLLPWGQTTVLGQVILTLQRAGLEEILVVSGGSRAEVETIARSLGADTVYNDGYAQGGMISSIQVALRLLAARPAHPVRVEAALICLGDQPQVQEETVRAVVERFRASGAPLVVPSYRMRRGHPWLVSRQLWDDLLGPEAPKTARQFLQHHASLIDYVIVETPSILADLDTPEDYQRWQRERINHGDAETRR